MILLSSAFAQDAVIEARWRAGRAQLHVTPHPGLHVNEQAPARLSNGVDEVRGTGALAWARIPATGTLRAEIPVCTDDGRTCRIVIAEGVPSGVSGRAQLLPPAPPPVATGPGRVVRLYDFSAVWCPPCNLMKAEVLDNPSHAGLLAPYRVDVLDVDLPSSWPLKTRYDVGGYPTLIAVDAAGAEIDRYVGYVSEDHLAAWIGALRTQVPVSEVGAEGAAEGALRLARAGDLERARSLLATSQPGTAAFHEAHLLVEPAVADADWLLANAPSGAWLVDVLTRWPERWGVVAPRVASLDASLAADCLQALADGSPDQALVARVGAAALVRTRTLAEPGLAKGHVLARADLLAQVGDLPSALALLSEYDLLFPDEFTFDFAAARLLLDAGRASEAEQEARAALDTARGDQRLRAVMRLARALDAQGQRTGAVAALRSELTATLRPGAESRVRTSRYIGEVETLLSELGG